MNPKALVELDDRRGAAARRRLPAKNGASAEPAPPINPCPCCRPAPPTSSRWRGPLPGGIYASTRRYCTGHRALLAEPVAVAGPIIPETPIGREDPESDPANDGGSLARLLAAEMANYQDLVEEFPIAITRETVQHGFDRFMIYCVVCHDALGTGHGKIVERGYTRPPSYHIERLRNAPVGHFFRVISNGYGSMPSYAAQISPRDRWAITAYIRALQLSQHCPAADAPPQAQDQKAPAAGAVAKRELP